MNGLDDDKYQNIFNPISTELELNNTLQLDNSSLDNTLIENSSISNENSGTTSRFHSSFLDLSIVTGPSKQDHILTNEISYPIDDSKLLSSTGKTTNNIT